MPVVIPEGYVQFAHFLVPGTVYGTPPWVVTQGAQMGVNQNLVDNANMAHLAFGASILQETWNQLQCVKTTASVQVDGSTFSVDSTEAPGQGALNIDPALGFVAVVLQKRTGTLGRTGRGRMMMPAMLATEEVNAGLDIDPLRAGDCLDAFNLYLAGLVAGDPDPDLSVVPVVLHTDDELDPSPITGTGISSKAAFLHSRIK